MAKNAIEELERHRQRGRPHRVVLLLNATVHQAGVHGSHDGDDVSHALIIPENDMDNDAWDPS